MLVSQWPARYVEDEYGLEGADGGLVSPRRTRLQLYALRNESGSSYVAARARHDNRPVSLRRRHAPHCDLPPYWVRELSALKALAGRAHVLELLDFAVTNSESSAHLTLVFPRFDRTLEVELAQTPGLLHRRIFTGLSYLHTEGFMHRNLNLRGLAITQDGELQITGFSSVRPFSITSTGPYTADVGMYWSQAPEMLLRSPHYNPKVDIWSAACVVARLVLGKELFAGDSQVHCLFLIFQLLGTPTEECWPGVTKLASASPNWPKWPWAPNRVGDLLQQKARQAENPAVELRSEVRALLQRLLAYVPRRPVLAQDVLEEPFFSDAIGFRFDAGRLEVFPVGHARTFPAVTLDLRHRQCSRVHLRPLQD